MRMFFFNLVICVSDGATSNNLFKKSEVASMAQNTVVLDMVCQCHGIHLASANQTCRLDLPTNWFASDEADKAAAGADKADKSGRDGKVGTGRGRGRGKITNSVIAEAESSNQTHKKKQKRSVAFLSNLVRVGKSDVKLWLLGFGTSSVFLPFAPHKVKFSSGYPAMAR